MPTIEAVVDIDLAELSDEDVQKEYQARFGPGSNQRGNPWTKLAELLNLGKQAEADQLIADMCWELGGKIVV